MLFKSSKEDLIFDIHQSELTKVNWEAAVYHLASNKSHGIGSVHRLAYSPIQMPAFSAVLEAFFDTCIGIRSTLITSADIRISGSPCYLITVLALVPKIPIAVEP